MINKLDRLKENAFYITMKGEFDKIHRPVAFLHSSFFFTDVLNCTHFKEDCKQELINEIDRLINDVPKGVNMSMQLKRIDKRKVIYQKQSL